MRSAERHSHPSPPLRRNTWGEVRQWKTVFESFGAPGLFIDQLVSAFRPLDEIASPGLVKEIRLDR